MNVSNYKDDLLTDLKDPEFAAEYLSAAMRESLDAFLLAVGDVLDASLQSLWRMGVGVL